jgi:threonyl-tRNA synthetase
MERFVAVLLEHCGGNFPLWLTPDQVVILPISEKYVAHAQTLLKLLDNCDIRALVDERNEKTGRKIRDAELNKIPFMLIIGEKEVEEGTVSVRKHGKGDLGSMELDEFTRLVEEEVKKELATD